jgi:flagellar hook-basal body protein
MTVRSLYMGLTGLTAMGNNIDVIGNNIANVNTVGFRASRATFDDIFYQTLFAGVGSQGNSGGVNPTQLGTGVKLGSVDLIFTQGSPQTTGRLLDLAINGDGFYVLEDGVGREYLSRAGNFSLDDDGFIIDPSTGLRLIGQNGDENGNLLENEAPSALQIDLARKSLAKATEEVVGGGNFDARVGDPNSNVEVDYASSTTNLLGMFDENGEAFGLINGDVFKLETGFLELGDPPNNIQSPVDLTTYDIGLGNGVIMTITQTTTLKDMQDALNNFFLEVFEQIDPASTSGIEVSFDSAGSFEFNNFGINAITGMRMGIGAREGSTVPPEDASRKVGELFSNDDNPDLSKTLNVGAGEVVNTNTIRNADRTTSIDIYDSKGHSHTITVGLAQDTTAPAGTRSTNFDSITDISGTSLIPGGILPPQPEYFGPDINSSDNTATMTVRQISNVVATQGVYTFNSGDGTLVAIRLSDGAISFDGGAFNVPIQADGTIDAEFTTAGIDVTGDSFLNLTSNTNSGGGLLGDDGITENTTLEDLRLNLEDRINTSIRQIAAGIANINGATTTLVGVPAAGLTVPTDVPEITLELNEEGAFEFSSEYGSLGDSVSTDATINTNLAAAAGGADNLGFVLDLAAKTRSIRFSTIDSNGTYGDPTDDIADGKVDEDFTDGGGITRFKESADPFDAVVTNAFEIGNTDFADYDTTGNPTIGNPGTAEPTGIDDSGTVLIALSSGTFPTNDNLTAQRFNGVQAFDAEETAFTALFNQRGFGIAKDFDNDGSVDRTSGVPVGVVARSTDTKAFETNTVHTEGLTRNTIRYQAIVPNDRRSIPTNTTGRLVFDSTGRFRSYGYEVNDTDAPTISFDADNGDPEGGGALPVTFKLNLNNMTHFASDHTAQLQSQDGRPIGTMDNVSISSDGEIIGIFTNGDTQSLGKILLATVTNEGGLIQEGNTMFTVGPNAGDRVFVEAGVEGGTINSGSLELSNVDLAQEFTNLIVAQRAYSANARVITTGDQILQEVVQLKR